MIFTSENMKSPIHNMLNTKGTNNATYNGENVYWYDNFEDNIKRLRNGNRYEFSVKKDKKIILL